MPKLRPHEFTLLCGLLKRLSGIHLAGSKIQLMEGRLNRRLAVLNLSSYAEYYRYLELDRHIAERTEFVNAMTTNMTSFFREAEALHEIIEVCENQHSHEMVYIWSAACSTGQEVYSAAILLETLRKRYPDFDYRILGSDIDSHCLARAERGLFKPSSLSPLSKSQIAEHFSPVQGRSGLNYRISPAIRNRVKFRQLNLSKPNALSLRVQFHFALLRNVLIYFEESTADQIVKNVAQRLVPGGTLYLGSCEHLESEPHWLLRTGNSSYRRTKAA